MHEKWFISDTHFFHDNTWKVFKDLDGSPLRPFTSTHEMNEQMVLNWNSVVAPHDYVYHLGDVTFRYDGEMHNLMHQLNGRKRLILGNHDKIKGNKLIDFFEKVELWKGFKDGNFTCSHIPLMLESLRDGAFNVHGHVHNNSLKDPHYLNMSVEVNDYTPVHYDTIVERIKQVKS